MVKQGTIDVRADKVVVTRPGGDSNKMVIEAFGNPVTFYQMQDNGKPIKGRGSKLRYEMANELVTLTGNAYRNSWTAISPVTRLPTWCRHSRCRHSVTKANR